MHLQLTGRLPHTVVLVKVLNKKLDKGGQGGDIVKVSVSNKRRWTRRRGHSKSKSLPLKEVDKEGTRGQGETK